MKQSKSLITIIKEKAAKADISKNSHYVFLTGKGIVKEYLNDICYARFTSESGIVRARVFINQHKRPEVDVSSWKAWFKWVVFESHWSKAFKSVKNWEKEGISLNCTLPADYVGGAITALREGYEFPTNTNVWKKMVDAGINPYVAHAFSNRYKEQNPKDETLFTFYSKGHHGAISDEITKEGIKKYVEGDFNKKKQPLRKKYRHSFGGIWDMLPRDYHQKQFTYEFLQTYVKTKGEGWHRQSFIPLNDAVISAIKSFEQELLK